MYSRETITSVQTHDFIDIVAWDRVSNFNSQNLKCYIWHKNVKVDGRLQEGGTDSAPHVLGCRAAPTKMGPGR